MRVGGVFVFVVGQVVQRFFLEPVQEQRKVIGEATYAVLYCANVYRLPREEIENMSEQRLAQLEDTGKTLRGLAAQLQSTLRAIPAYDTMARMEWVPKRSDVLTASREFVGWSNSVYNKVDYEGHRDRRMTIIVDALSIIR